MNGSPASKGMKERVLAILEDSLRVKEACIRGNADLIVEGAFVLARCLASGHKILLFGNGGSAADCQHIAAEFVNRFTRDRAPLPALALTTDTSVLTSIGNDDRFENIFARQVLALGASDDLAWGISTSGKSPNVVAAMKAARSAGLVTLAMTGRDGGPMAPLADVLFAVDSAVTARIQETHITMAHILCDLVEDLLFPGSAT